MKVGILTQYFGSHNYGGLLQAYALVYVLRQNGFDAEQICYIPSGVCLDQTSLSMNGDSTSRIKRYIDALLRKIENKRLSRIIEIRNKKCEGFANTIPHSKTVYSKYTIKESNLMYDGFVAGSDQIWNPRSLDTTYFLDFADENKKTVAYAASVCRDSLSEVEKKVFRRGLENLNAVSLRENCVDVLQELTDKPVQCVLDPTMLLPKEHWESITCERLIEDEYILCYFLGDNLEQRKIAKEYANRNHLILVTMPHLAVKVEVNDIGFGDKQLVDISPQEFLSLIKYAKCVFTDSFHATVFSLLFQKNFFVFQRSKEKGMTSRINTLLQLYDQCERFCDSKTTLSEILQLDARPKDTMNNQNAVESIRKLSIEYLLCSLDLNYLNK